MRDNTLVKTYPPLHLSVPEDKKASAAWYVLGVFATSAIITFLGSNVFSALSARITAHNVGANRLAATPLAVRIPPGSSTSGESTLGETEALPSKLSEHQSQPAITIPTNTPVIRGVIVKPVSESGRLAPIPLREVEIQVPAPSQTHRNEHLYSQSGMEAAGRITARPKAQQLVAPDFTSSLDQAKQESDAQRLLNDVANQQQTHALALGHDFTAERPTRLKSSEVTPDGSSRDATAILAALQRYSNSWNAKALADITALRPGLDRRVVKEELSSSRRIVMRIRPTSAPKIEGDRATVQCLHQVNQVFADGSVKQNPGIRMTYVLVKRGGSWLIADSR